MVDTTARAFLCFADQRRGEEVGSVLLELTVAEQRFNAVMEVLRDGLTVIEVADRYGVSRQAVHGWLRRYRTGGLEALADRSHRPHSCPHQMPAEIEARLCELRRHHPGWGQRRLAHELARDGVDPPPGLTSIYRALVRNDLIQPRSHRRAKASYRRWERARPMELWQLDVMGGIWLTDGRELKAVTGIDDHSRFCVAAGLVERANARAVCRIFTHSLARYGVPEELLTDNGKVFTGRFGPQPVEVLFDRICRENAITHRLTQPRSPTTTGKIERFHRTLRTEFRTDRVFTDLAAAQTELDEWVADYNTVRPHQAIAMVPPAERFGQQRSATVTPIVPPAERPNTRGQGTWVARRASAVGVVTVDWQQVSVGIAAAGRNIDVWVTDDVLQFFDGDHLLRTEQRVNHGPVRKKRASVSTTSTPNH